MMPNREEGDSIYGFSAQAPRIEGPDVTVSFTAEELVALQAGCRWLVTYWTECGAEMSLSVYSTSFLVASINPALDELKQPSSAGGEFLAPLYMWSAVWSPLLMLGRIYYTSRKFGYEYEREVDPETLTCTVDRIVMTLIAAGHLDISSLVWFGALPSVDALSAYFEDSAEVWKEKCEEAGVDPELELPWDPRE